jgi:hypothetical protein
MHCLALIYLVTQAVHVLGICSPSAGDIHCVYIAVGVCYMLGVGQGAQSVERQATGWMVRGWNPGGLLQVTVFTFCRTCVRQESFLKKSARKSLVFVLLLNFIDVQGLRGVKMSLKFRSLSCSKISNNVSAQFKNFFERLG